MNKQQAHIDQLFRRYLNGDIGPREEAELEAYAQEEEALARAMQAIREQPTLDHAAAVGRIKSRLPRAASRKRSAMYRWTAAACALLLVGASLLWLPEWLGNKQGDVAMRTSRQQEIAIPEPTELAEKATLSEAAAEAPPAIAAAEPTPEKPGVEKKARKLAASPATEAEEMEPAILAETLVFDEVEAVSGEEPIQQADEVAAIPPTAAKRTRAEAPPAPTPLSAPPTAQPTKSQAATQLGSALRLPSIAGYITNEEGAPIEAVEVLLAGQPMGIRTDSSGFFALKGIQGSERIILSHPDYQRLVLATKEGNRELQIVLEANQATADTDWMLESARTTIYPNRPLSFAYPEQGMKALKQEIIQQIPAEFKQGKLRISFTVDASGQLGNFTAADNTQPALLENVRNYLQQNSRWQLSGEAEAPVSVSMLLRW